MEKITSFTIDHIKLQPGLYVSRKDRVGAETVTTFDLRLTSPNEEPVMNTAEMHTIEHLAHGLPHRILPAVSGRLRFPGRGNTGWRLFPVCSGLPGGCPRCQREGLRQLSGHESANGKLLG